MMIPSIVDPSDPWLLQALHQMGDKLNGVFARRPKPPNMPPITNNGYRFRYFRDFDLTLQYNEYWYFGFHDNATGLAGMIAYGVFHPDGAILGRSLISAALFEPGASTPYRSMDLYPMKQFSAREDRAEVRIGDDNRVDSGFPDGGQAERYRIRGRTRDGAMRWDLTYEAVNPPFLAGDHLPGPLNWEFDSWILALPGARVTGSLTLHGARYDIQRGGGYHDHSWGVWLLSERIWAWATASDPERGIHLIVGYKCGFAVSTAYLTVGGRTLFFESHKTGTAMEWEADPGSWSSKGGDPRHPYPTDVTMRTSNAEGKATVRWRVTSSVLIDKSPIALWEQAARIDVEVEFADGQKHSEVDLVGHSQFITRWLTPTPPGTSLGHD